MTTPDYARGDALVTAPTLSTASVAEGFMADAGIATGSSAWSISAPLTLSVAGAVSLSFNYSNQFSLVNTTTPSGAVSADYNYTFSIKDSGGSIVFTSSPNAVNEALSLSSQGSNSPAGSGSISITSTTLTAGTYTMTLSGSSHVFINAVPEPSTDALLVSGAALIAGLALKLRRRSA
jgi:hypothetical protein